LSDLVSSTQILEQQAELATALAPLRTLSTPLSVPVPAEPTSPTSSIVADYQELQTQLKALSDLNFLPTTDPASGDNQQGQ
ncbi:MAG: hypothetical protein AAFW75_29690, partial [Cyanobacteria bacterium J06636_16]